MKKDLYHCETEVERFEIKDIITALIYFTKKGERYWGIIERKDQYHLVINGSRIDNFDSINIARQYLFKHVKEMVEHKITEKKEDIKNFKNILETLGDDVFNLALYKDKARTN